MTFRASLFIKRFNIFLPNIMFKHVKAGKHIERVFTHEISPRDEIIPVYGEMYLTVQAFLPRRNFIPGQTYPCQKDRDEVSSQD